MYREETGSLDCLCCLVGIRKEIDECLGSRDFVLIAVIENAKAPDTAAQFCLSIVRREQKRKNLVAVIRLSHFISGIGIGLLRRVPAKRHCKNALTEQVDFIAADKGSVKVNALLILECRQSLYILIGIRCVLRVLRVCKRAAVHIVDQSSGSLVAALACTVNRQHIFLSAVINRLYCLQEILCGFPGIRGFIDILHRVRFLHVGLVDCHAVRYHAERIFIYLSVFAGAGVFYRFVKIGCRVFRHNIGEIHHISLGAPVCNQSFRSFKDHIRCLSAFDRGIDLIVAVRVIKIFYGNLNIGILRVEVGNQCVDRSRIAPFADRICPKCDRGVQISAFGGSCGFGRSCRSFGCRALRCLRFRCIRRCLCGFGRSACGQPCCHNSCKTKCQYLFHVFPS